MIFLASLAGYQATASFATYGATKAFTLMIGEALWKECLLAREGVLRLRPRVDAAGVVKRPEFRCLFMRAWIRLGFSMG